MSRRLLSLITVVLLLSAFSVAQASSVSVASVSPIERTPTTQIIMRDGGVCDPIRHMGC